MGCIWSRKNEPHYDPVCPYIDEEYKKNRLTLSEFFNIWIPFRTPNEERVSRIFYRNYNGKVPDSFYKM